MTKAVVASVAAATNLKQARLHCPIFALGMDVKRPATAEGVTLGELPKAVQVAVTGGLELA